MCQFLSAIVTRQGDIYSHPLTDSHTDLITLFNLKEGKAAQNFVRVEFTAQGADIFDVNKYKFRVDETRTPAWFDDEVLGMTIVKLRVLVKKCIIVDERPLLIGGTYLIGDKAKIAKVSSARIIAVHAGAYMAGAYMARANMAGANMEGAYMARAYMARANMEGVRRSADDHSISGWVRDTKTGLLTRDTIVVTK